MHSGAWEAILRMIPPQQQDQYSLVTAAGVEISLQSFLRIDAEFVVVKGRLSGSQEQGRVFFIPYDHIDYFGTSKPVKDTEYLEVFGNLQVPVPSSSGEVRVPVSNGPTEGAAPVQPGPARPVSPSALNEAINNGVASDGSGPRPIIRSEVLDRFRSSRIISPASASNLPRPNGQ